MRIKLAVAMLTGVVAAPTIAVAQDVIVRERSERVIVREPEEGVVVHRAPSTVRRYVVEERRPSIAYERRVVVGDMLPNSVDTFDVPDSDYEYVVLNERRYIVDDDRRIVDVVD